MVQESSQRWLYKYNKFKSIITRQSSIYIKPWPPTENLVHTIKQPITANNHCEKWPEGAKWVDNWPLSGPWTWLQTITSQGNHTLTRVNYGFLILMVFSLFILGDRKIFIDPIFSPNENMKPMKFDSVWNLVSTGFTDFVTKISNNV